MIRNQNKKRGSNLIKKTLEEKINLSDSTFIDLKRSDQGWSYLAIACGILIALSIAIIQVIEILSSLEKVILILLTAIISIYLCFFNVKFRNSIVKFFQKSKDLIEKKIEIKNN